MEQNPTFLTDPQDLEQLRTFTDALGLLACNTNEGRYQSLKLAYYPFITTQKQYDEAGQISLVWHKLLLNASKDSELLKRTFSGIAAVDQLIGKTYSIYLKKLQQIKQHQTDQNSMLIIRSDYFFNQDNMFKLVQVNLISVSTTTQVQKFQKIRKLMDINKTINFPQNQPGTNVCAAIANIYKIKKLQGILLMIVSYRQKNIIEQACLQMELLKYGIQSKREPLCNLINRIKLVNNQLYLDQKLVSFVYYRSAYMPSHFCENQSSKNECWKIKQTIELSDAIKIPNITMDLMNQKKMQAELSKPQVYSKYLSPEDCKILETSLVNNWDFDQQQESEKIIKMIKQKGCDKFVLKPNLEGGANNFYGQDILKILQNSSFEQRKKYILMQKIIPKCSPNLFFKGQKLQKYDKCHHQCSRYGLICEVNGEIIQNTLNGYLIRAKSANNNQSGVLSGVGAYGLWALSQK